MKKIYKENIFTQIIHKQIPSNIVLENDYILAFYDIKPDAKHHILLIPKGQYVDYMDFYLNASDKEKEEFYKGIYEVINIMKFQNFSLLTNNGAGAHQVIFHFHMHILSNDD